MEIRTKFPWISLLLKIGIVFLINLLLWPVFLVFELVIEFCRALVSLSFKCSKKYSFSPASMDSFFASGGLEESSLVVAFFSRDGVDLRKERKMWETRVLEKREPNGELTYQKFMKTLVTKCGYPCLRDDQCKFDLNDHVKIFDGCASSNQEHFTEEEVYNNVVPMLFGKMDTSKPQWEWVIIPKILDSKGNLQSARFLRFSHCYMDGPHLALLLGECIFDWTLDDPKKSPPYIIDPKATPQNLTYNRTLLTLLDTFFFPFVVLSQILGIKPDDAKDPFFARKRGNPHFVFGDPIHNSLVHAAFQYSGRRQNQSAISTTALRKSFAKIAEKRGIRGRSATAVRVNIPSALTPYKDSRPSNEFTVLNRTLWFDREGFEDLQPGLDIMTPYLYLSWLGRLPKILANNFRSSVPTVTVSNVPFSRQEGTINGSRIQTILGWTNVQRPAGITILIIGYAGKIQLSVMAENEALTKDEATLLCTHFEEEIEKGAEKPLKWCHIVDIDGK